VAIAYMIFNEYNEIWQTGIKNCLNKSFLLEQLKELMILVNDLLDVRKNGGFIWITKLDDF
jgi:hypothetical protein